MRTRGFLYRDDPIRVLFVISGLNRGGMEGHLVDLVNHLDRRRIVPMVCVMHDGALIPNVREDVPVFTNLYAWAGDLRGLPRLTRIMRTQQPTIVDTLGRDDAALWGRLAARLTGVPLIVHSDHHGRFEPAKERKRWLYHILNRVVDPWTDAFVTVSHEQRAFHAEIGLPEQRMTVIHNGIDVNRFDSSQEARWSARQRLGLSLEAPIIGMTANFSVNKNHTLLLQALVKIRESIPNVHCLLIGDGPTRRSIESMTHQMGLAEAVSFLGIRSDLPDLLSALDVFVLTSLSESFSLAIVEAMACGKPVVATDSGGPKEIVLDGETGYLVPHEEPSVLAEKITLLLVSPVLAQRLGQAGRQRAVQYFSLDKMVAAREAFYLKLVSDKGIAAV